MNKKITQLIGQILTGLCLVILIIAVMVVTKTASEKKVVALPTQEKIQTVDVRVTVEDRLLEKIQELTRQNVWLQQENDSLKYQIKEFGWLKE